MSQLTRRGAAGLMVAGLFAAPALAQTPYARPVAGPLVLRPDQADLLRATLASADRHGFEPGEFAPRGDSEAALVEATQRYAKAVKIGRLDIANFRDDWGLRPMPFDARGDLTRAVADNRLEAWLASLPPPYPGYEILQTGLANYRAIKDRGVAAGGRP
jgi:murein L,D-transpeptidase YcbB/YkuD